MKLLSIIIALLLITGCTNVEIPEDKAENVVVEPSVEEIIENEESKPSVDEKEENVVPESTTNELSEELTQDNIEEKTEVIGTKEMFADYYEEANKVLKEMTLKEKIAQMFLVIYPGDEKALNQIEKYNPGGYILFANDVKNETKDSLKAKIEKIQDKSKVKMMIAVDEEGETVVRLSGYKQYRDKKFDSPRNIYEKSGMDAVVTDSHDKNEFLKSFGVNMNLAPVVDIPTGKSSYMYKRAISVDEKIASEFASKVISKMNEDKVISSMKHFPGYGDNVDTHTGIAIDERTKEDFFNKDFLPFIAGIEAGAPTIMVNHNVIKEIDDKYPASISTEVHNILRNELNYSGLIITDSLAMDAIKTYVENGEAGAQAVISGNDMIISSTLETHINEIVNAINDGRIEEKKIEDAARRVIACKICFGIE